MQNFAKREKKEGVIGYIYVIKAGKAYKIGKEKIKNGRIYTHNTSNPNKVKTIVHIRVFNYDEAEKELLEMFKEQNIKGEWFNLYKKDISSIRKYLNRIKYND